MSFNQVILELRVFESTKKKEFPNTESRRKILHTWEQHMQRLKTFKDIIYSG